MNTDGSHDESPDAVKKKRKRKGARRAWTLDEVEHVLERYDVILDV